MNLRRQACLLRDRPSAALAGMWGCARPHCFGHRHQKQVPAQIGSKFNRWDCDLRRAPL